MDIVADIFRDKTIEDTPQDISLELPTVNAATQIVGYLPYCLVPL
jgi:hypothetical protein